MELHVGKPAKITGTKDEKHQGDYNSGHIHGHGPLEL